MSLCVSPQPGETHGWEYNVYPRKIGGVQQAGHHGSGQGCQHHCGGDGSRSEHRRSFAHPGAQPRSVTTDNCKPGKQQRDNCERRRGTEDDVRHRICRAERDGEVNCPLGSCE